MNETKGFIRKTRQRDLILKTLRGTKSHPTADWIYEQVKKKMPNISLGTVYRNLGILREMGEIMELNYGSKYSRFDGNPENHYHFVCTVCGAIIDVENCPVEKKLDECVAEKNNVKVFSHRAEFYGICNKCNNQQPPADD